MKEHKIWVVVFLFYLLPLPIFPSSYTPSIPFMTTNYDVSEYLGSTQIWDIEDNGDETVFFATASGLSVFDGVRFSNYKLNEFTLFRCLTYDKKTQRLYAAADNQFGYWKKNDFGEYLFTSLYKNQKHEKPDIFWAIIQKDDFIFLQTETRVLSYHIPTAHLEVLLEGESINFTGLADDKLWIQKNNILYSFADSLRISSWQPNQKIVYLEEKNNRRILVTEEAVYKDDVIIGGEPLHRLKEKQIFSATSLNDSILLLGTVLDGLYAVNTNTEEIVNHYNQQRGLQYTTVLSLHVDNLNNIWFGLDGGLSVINSDSPEQIYKHFGSDIGFVYSFTPFHNQIYLGTNKGLFVLSEDHTLSMVKNSQGQVWDIFLYNDLLIISHDKGIFWLQNGELIKSDVPKFWMLQDLGRDNLFLSVDFHGGLSLYKITNKKLEYIKKVQGFDASPTRINRDRYGYLWSIDGLNRPIRLVLDEQYNVASWENYIIPDIQNINAALLDNDIVFFGNNKAFTYNVLKNKLEQNPYYTSLINTCATSPYFLTQIGNHFIYGSDSYIGYLERKENEIINKGEILKQIDMAYAPLFARKIKQISPSLVGLGISNGVAFFDIKKIKIEKEKKIVLEKAEVHFPDTTILLPVNQGGTLSIRPSYLQMNLFLSHLPNKCVYYRINNGEWKIENAYPYLQLPHLPYGDHIIQLSNNPEAKDILELSISVSTPWYLSSFFKFFGIVLLGLIAFIIQAVFKMRIKQQKKIIIKKQQAILSKEKQEFEMKMLKMKIKEDQKTLVNLTMNGIQRNTMLSELKTDILDLKDMDSSLIPKKINSLLKKIEKQLTSKEDWELFEKYFNTIHDGFCLRLEQNYPNLTSNEKKLCILLRLNMSTKDIAGFLNISINSVEVARHRLRKKIDLNSEDSLQSHISKL